MNIEEEIESHRRYRERARKDGRQKDVDYNDGVLDTLERLEKGLIGETEYPQATEDNEYRYIDAGWLDEIAAGLTAGAAKYPGETWRSTPADEHAARAIRDLNLYRMGDRQDNHLINASMRCMMACVTDTE